MTGALPAPALKSYASSAHRDQKAFIRQAIESGRLHREEDAIKEALSLWEERERRRLETLVAIDGAKSSLARGEGRTVTTEAEFRQLAGDIKRCGMVRLNPEKNRAHEQVPPCAGG